MANSTSEAEQKDHTSGELIASSQDLAAQILLCLPARLVFNSKLVSKQWFSIISDPDFIRSYTLSRPVTLSGLFLHYLAGPRALAVHDYIAFNPIDRKPYHPRAVLNAQICQGLKIIQSCNGLLLCSTSNSEYYIYNPTTFQSKRLALPRGMLCGNDFSLNLVFDPNKSLHYKVVCVRRCLGVDRYQLQVYSSETGLWRNSGDPFIEPDVSDFKHGIYCKGAIHWIKTTWNCLYFDVENECIRLTPKPPLVKLSLFQRHEYFGQCNGRLYLVVKGRLPNFTLLEMKDDYSGWFVKYISDLEELATKFPSMTRNFHNTTRISKHYECSVVCIGRGGSRNGKEDGLEIVISTPGEIVVIDPHTNASRKITDLVLQPHSMSFWFKFSAHEYFETLCPV